MKVYSLKEASKILGVSVRTLQRWDAKGEIKCIKTAGGRRKIPGEELRRLLKLMGKTMKDERKKEAEKYPEAEKLLREKEEQISKLNGELEKLKAKCRQLELTCEKLKQKLEQYRQQIGEMLDARCPKCGFSFFNYQLRKAILKSILG